MVTGLVKIEGNHEIVEEDSSMSSVFESAISNEDIYNLQISLDKVENQCESMLKKFQRT